MPEGGEPTLFRKCKFQVQLYLINRLPMPEGGEPTLFRNCKL